RRLAIETVSGTLRGRVHHRVDGGFTDLVYDIQLTGEISDDAIKPLSAEAERYCYVHNTLRNAVPLTVRLHLNGRKVAERISRSACFASSTSWPLQYGHQSALRMKAITAPARPAIVSSVCRRPN